MAAQPKRQEVRGPDLRKGYSTHAKCEVCGKPIRPGMTWKFTPSGGRVHYYCAQNPYGEPSGFRKPERSRYTVVRHTRELIGYGEKDQPIYRLEPTVVWSRAKAIAMARRMEASGGRAEVFDEIRRVRIYPSGEANPVSLDPRYWLRHGTVMVPPRRVPAGRKPEWPETFSYKGARIWRTGAGWRVSTDPESEFESLREARRFLDHPLRRNPLPSQYAPLDWSEMEGRYVAAEDLGWFLNKFVYVVVDTKTGELVREHGGEGRAVRSSGPLKTKKLAQKLNRPEKRAA